MEAEDNIAFVSRWMTWLGLADRWIFRPPGSKNKLLGATEAELARLYADADVVINVCGAQEIREEHGLIRRMVYLETDPVQDQVRVALGDDEAIAKLDAHHFHFTYGENLGAVDCPVPIGRYQWRPTRPPVILDWWESSSVQPRAVLTTIANWKHAGKDVVWKDHSWHWSKDREFRRFRDLPRRSALPIELALGSIDDSDSGDLIERGWRLIPSISDPEEYREYVFGSAGEFTVAKEQYVAPRSGWFSDRSACYLAAGRPVVTQDTGFGKFVPTGNGLFAYSTLDEAAAAIEAIAANYDHHSAAAREIAREYFDAERLLSRMLDQVGLS